MRAFLASYCQAVSYKAIRHIVQSNSLEVCFLYAALLSIRGCGRGRKGTEKQAVNNYNGNNSSHSILFHTGLMRYIKSSCTRKILTHYKCEGNMLFPYSLGIILFYKNIPRQTKQPELQKAGRQLRNQ